jgi:hypothetical protein
LINWLKRMAPKVNGITLSRISPAGTHHGVRVFLADTFIPVEGVIPRRSAA